MLTSEIFGIGEVNYWRQSFLPSTGLTLLFSIILSQRRSVSFSAFLFAFIRHILFSSAISRYRSTTVILTWSNHFNSTFRIALFFIVFLIICDPISPCLTLHSFQVPHVQTCSPFWSRSHFCLFPLSLPSYSYHIHSFAGRKTHAACVYVQHTTWKRVPDISTLLEAILSSIWDHNIMIFLDLFWSRTIFISL